MKTFDKEFILQEYLKPSSQLLNDIIKIDGDILILGAGGKMGPAMAKLAKEAINETNIQKQIIAVSRFSDPDVWNDLNKCGITTIKADLLNEDDLKKLPDTPNVIYLAGHKFGTTGNESYTWAMNTFLPGIIAQKFKQSNIVVFSSGNVYPLSPVTSGGMTEDMPASPIGEYAQSCLGRERIFQYFSKKYNTPILIYRLNYANDVSYGVLLEIARSVYGEKEIDLTMGNVNVIWQGDANEIAIRSLLHCSVPGKIVNITGPETISVRWIAEEFGKVFNKTPKFTGIEASNALLSNAAECFRLFGYPHISLGQMINLISHWVIEGGKIKEKPTHFQERKGKF
ncbi:NAD-dependent epimerase/dehydratase family protein [Proteiniphilum acetatigenes]|uniref:NAD-dependent epimerase/dehydratase family protein n=1 Tax=Proteiniphilum acetatigenes TaxID=294710 RepID=UPI000375C50A|nr:NAD(P)-dependent oxidoreductase [Proteiniphilum acetatigenes]